MHPVLRVEQQRLHAEPEHPLEEGDLEAAPRRLVAQHGGAQLLVVADEDELPARRRRGRVADGSRRVSDEEEPACSRA